MSTPAPNATWKILAAIDLASPNPSASVEHALNLARALKGEATLVSVVDRRQYERGLRHCWPPNAYGSAHRDVDIHRIVLPGSPPEALSAYADQIRADLLVVDAGYSARRWLRNRPVAASVAALTSRAVWITPGATNIWTSEDGPRIACLLRLDETDKRTCCVGQAVAERCGGELYLVHRERACEGAGKVTAADPADWTGHIGRSLGVRWRPLPLGGRQQEALTTAVKRHRIRLVIAGRPMFVTPSARSGDLLLAASRLSCPLLSLPYSSASTRASVLSATA